MHFHTHLHLIVKKNLNFHPAASEWGIHHFFSNPKVGRRIFFLIRRFYAKHLFYDTEASVEEFK